MTDETQLPHPGGRPTKFKPEFCEQAEKLCKLGATDAEMSDFFQIATSTLYEWKLEYEEFSEAIKRGKLLADAEVASKLYHRAIGYSHPDVHVSQYEGQVTITDIEKHYAPDTQAAIHWLNNRQPDRWRNKQEISGGLKHTHEIASLSDEELDAELDQLDRAEKLRTESAAEGAATIAAQGEGTA